MSYNRPPNVVITGNALKQNPAPTTVTPPGIVPVVLEAEIASKTQLGVVQIGDNINVTPEGVISVSLNTGNCSCKTKTIDSNYTLSNDDYYIGVNSSGPVAVTLPNDPTECLKFIVKVQMGAPIGNKKVTVLPQGSATIDGAVSYVMSVPYESVTVIYNDGHWWIV